MSQSSFEVEQALLGSLLIRPSEYEDVSRVVESKDFQYPNSLIYTAISDLHRSGKPIELMTLNSELSRQGQLVEVGGIAKLTELTDTVLTGTNAKAYAGMVADNSLRRNIERYSEYVAQAAKSSVTTPQLLNKANEAMQKILIERDRKSPKQDLVMLGEYLEAADKMIAQGDELIGLSTGYPSLDKMTGGIGPSELVVVFGETSHGKSQLVQNIAYNVARAGHPVMFIGLEMTNVENTVRVKQLAGGDDLVSLPIIFPKKMDLRIEDFPTLFKTAKDNRVEMIVIDHLHAIPVSNKSVSTADAISEMMYEIKRLAREYEMPVLLVSHVNRGNQRKGMPEASDLKSSSAIEQCADILIAVWRDMTLDQADQILKVAMWKNRNRGRQHTRTEFMLGKNARLREPALLNVFPGSTIVPG